MPRGHFHSLLVALVALWIAASLGIKGPVGGVVLVVIFSIVIVAGIPATPARARVRIVQIALVLPAVLATLLTALNGHPTLLLGSRVLILAVLAVALGAIVSHLIRESRVTADTLSGAASGYLLLGVMFAVGFAIAESQAPGSVDFGRMADASRSGAETFTELLYFSFVTLTTLGYGDMTPVSPVARTLATGEAVLGQFYLAALVARLVGLLIASSHGATRQT